MEIQEVLHRWQAGNSLRQIASGTGLSRDTVGKYVAAAQGEGIAQDGPAPSEEQLSQLPDRHRGQQLPGTALPTPWPYWV